MNELADAEAEIEGGLMAVSTEILAEMENSGKNWKLASDPPVNKENREGIWSREVIVLTNYGDVFCLCYSGTKRDGIWQRPHRFNKGEKVDFWIDKP